MDAKAWFSGLAPRERMLVVSAAALAVVATVWLLVVSLLLSGQKQVREELRSQRALLHDLERVAAHPASRNSTPATTTAGRNESLVVLVDRSTRAAGLGGQLKRNEPDGDHDIRLRFENASFDELVAWLVMLQSEHAVSIMTMTADPGTEAGRVTANIQLRRTLP